MPMKWFAVGAARLVMRDDVGDEMLRPPKRCGFVSSSPMMLIFFSSS